MDNHPTLPKSKFLRSIVFSLFLGSGCLSLLLLVLFTTPSQASAQQADIQFLPPATYYGWITPTIGFSPTVNMTVIARINGINCGETTIQTIDGKLAYSIQVSAENASSPFNGCGTNDRKIVFLIGNWRMDQDRLWDNTQAWYHSLSRIIVTSTPTLTNTPTPTSMGTITLTPSSTPTKALTPTSTGTITLKPSSTLTKTLTPIPTGTTTLASSNTPTKTITPSVTPTPTPVDQKSSLFLPIVKR